MSLVANAPPSLLNRKITFDFHFRSLDFLFHFDSILGGRRFDFFFTSTRILLFLINFNFVDLTYNSRLTYHLYFSEFCPQRNAITRAHMKLRVILVQRPEIATNLLPASATRVPLSYDFHRKQNWYNPLSNKTYLGTCKDNDTPRPR